MQISIVSPVYKASKILPELVARLESSLLGITDSFEVILVDDGCPENSWEVIVALQVKYKFIKGIKLSRNFGQHFAITAGIKHSKGELIIVMDCDLQDDPKHIPDLVKEQEKGFEIVYTLRDQRNFGFIKNLWAVIFYKVYNYLIDDIRLSGFSNIGTYSLITRRVAEAYGLIGDHHRHYLMILRWLGFKHSFIEIEHQKRFEGKSGYTTLKLIKHAINGIIGNSDKLMRLMALWGALLSFIAFLVSLIITISYFIEPFQAGWASLIVLILFLGGLIISSIGVCGLYIAKIFDQTKNRPFYIISDIIGS
jgi:dolichol-phosphate mannosyltransferase